MDTNGECKDDVFIQLNDSEYNNVNNVNHDRTLTQHKHGAAAEQR